ncbi:hypothetical protein Tco_0446853 [Tanacetum coccineum]
MKIDRLSREYYYADHMNAILGIYTDLDKFTDLQCDYVETLEKCEHLEKELSKSRTMSKSFEALQKHAINLELDLQQCKEKIKNDKSFKENQSNVFLKEREQYVEIQDLKAQLQDKGIAINELKKLIEKMKGKSVETKFEKSSVIRQPNAFKSQRQSILEQIPNVVSSSHQKTQTPRQALNQVTELPQTSEPIPNVADEAVYEEWDDIVERATTTAASLDATQASGGSLKCQEATRGSIAQTRYKRVPTQPHDLPLPRETDLRQTKKVYGAAYTKLIMKVKKLEKTVSQPSKKSKKIVVSNEEEDLEDSSKHGRMIEEIDQDARVTLVTPTHSQEDQPEVSLKIFSAARFLQISSKCLQFIT